MLKYKSISNHFLQNTYFNLTTVVTITAGLALNTVHATVDYTICITVVKNIYTITLRNLFLHLFGLYLCTSSGDVN